MGINIHPNKDGSFTITCGDESATIGKDGSIAFGHAAQKIEIIPFPKGVNPGGVAPFPGGIPHPGGATAERARKPGGVPRLKRVDDLDSIVTAVREHPRGSSVAGRPLQLRWHGSRPLAVGKLEEALKTIKDQEDLRLEIHREDPDYV